MSELLTPEVREIALDDMRERAGCGDSEQTPSLDDCVYIGSVYQLKKDKAKFKGWKSPKEVEEIKVRGMEAGAVNESKKMARHLLALHEECDTVQSLGEFRKSVVMFALEALKDKP